MNTNSNGFFSFLNQTSPVTIVLNETDPNNPRLITPIVDKQTGIPKTDNAGNELGSIRVEQETNMLNGSFLNNRRRVAFIGGTIAALEALVAKYNIKAGMTLPGKIVIKESLEPMYNNQPAKMNPATQQPVGVTVDNKFYPVYMQMNYVEDPSIADKLIRSADDVISWINNRRVATAVAQQQVEHARIPQTEGAE
jgi:hypothetical protein